MYPFVNHFFSGRASFLSLFLCFLFSSVLHPGYSQDPSYHLSGELKKWHKVTLTFNGPETSEMDPFNPFLNYRLEVTFHHGESYYKVPGYFAADGDAAESSATTGNKWRVHFTPDQVGTWIFRVSFRKGSNIAVKDEPLAGESAGFMDGLTGSFEVASTDKVFPDLRSQGRLEYVGKPYLQFSESGQYFLKAGADAPENLLAYVDFDGNFKEDGYGDKYLKNWSPHVDDWEEGNPVWQGDKGKGLIGAINYLASKGMNAMSFLTLNIAGDDKNVFPYVSYDTYDRMDVSKLEQWEIVFLHASKLGLFLHFKTSEVENQGLLDNGELGMQRRLYYRELIARFGHHLALNWNIGEENGRWAGHHPTPWQNTTQRLAMARYFYEHDPYHHHLVIHNGQSFYDLLGPESRYTGISLQTNREDFGNVHRDVLHWREVSQDEGKQWAIALDEPGDHRYSLVPDKVDPNHNNARQNALWGALMAGAWGVEWYFGYEHVHSDLTCEDWRTRNNMWDQSRFALSFFKEGEIPFWYMQPDDDWTASDNDYVLRRGEDLFVIYEKQGEKSSSEIKASPGSYQVRWFNPRTGTWSGEEVLSSKMGSLALPLPPEDSEKDWVLLVQKEFEALFNGNDFSGWYRHLRDRPNNEDPNNVFQIMEDGSIYVSGEEFGYLATREEYDDFHLQLEFKWGEKKWPPRLDQKRDSGICYHFSAESEDKVWPRSVECQIQEGDVGDFWMIDSTTVIIDDQRTTPGNFIRSQKLRDAELPNRQWNRVEVIALEGNYTHIVNGTIVNEAEESNVRKGKILLQSEGAEIYFRNIRIKNLTAREEEK